MHKLAKGLKKKKKQKKGKKGEEEEFTAEELEKYRQEHAAEFQQPPAETYTEEGETATPPPAVDEWKKFQALTAGVDSILKKTQDDLGRIKESSFYQRKEVEPEPEPVEDPEVAKAREELSKRYVGFDKDGNPIEAKLEEDKKDKFIVNADGLVEIPDDDDENLDSIEEDIFDTTYIDVLQNQDVQELLAYIPDSPTEEELGDDPFDTTNADKVLKTVDKKGKKLVSLGNAVEVLAGRVEQAGRVTVSKSKRPKPLNLLGSFDENAPPPIEVSSEQVASEPIDIPKTLLDDDSDLPDIPIDLTKLPPILTKPVTPGTDQELFLKPLDVSEFELLNKDKTLLEDIPDLDEEEFNLDGETGETLILEEEEDPFHEKNKEDNVDDLETVLIEATFAAASFINEEDPFDTTIAENILPGKTELKFIERELEDFSISRANNSVTTDARLPRNTDILNLAKNKSAQIYKSIPRPDLLASSANDLNRLPHQPIQPAEEEISYVDPFDTSSIKQPPPGKTELKFLEKELLGEKQSKLDTLEDDDFDPRAGEPQQNLPQTTIKFQVGEEVFGEVTEPINKGRKASRPEVLDIATKVVAFELPPPKKDLLSAGEEEKSLPAKPLTPYYPQKSIDENLPIEEEIEEEDPFDTTFVGSNKPGKTELKIIESELLQEPITRSLSDNNFDPRADNNLGDSKVIKSSEVIESLINKKKKLEKRQESILDSDVDISAEALTPRPSKIEENEELSYADPFDTSVASNIGPGKTELKLLEHELNQVSEQPIRINPVLETINRAISIEEDPNFDPRGLASIPKVEQDILSIDNQEVPSGKILIPTQSIDVEEDIDPFDTSFANDGPGKTEIKFLESELNL